MTLSDSPNGLGTLEPRFKEQASAFAAALLIGGRPRQDRSALATASGIEARIEPRARDHRRRLSDVDTR